MESNADQEDKLVYVHDLPSTITEERIREIFSACCPISRLEFKNDENALEKKIAIIHFSSARGVHAALLMTRDPNNYDMTFSVSKQLRTGVSPNKPTSVPTLKLPVNRHKRRLSHGDVMFEVRSVYSNIEKVMDLITVHTLQESLKKNGYDVDEDQVRELFLNSFKPKNTRGVTYDEFVGGFVAYIKAVQKLPLRKDRPRPRLSRQKSLREELQEQKNLQEQLEKRANFQRLVALLGADEHVTNEFEIILSARQPKSPQAPNMVLTDSSEDLSLSVSRDFIDTPVGGSDEFKKSKITVRSYDEPKEPIENDLELPSIVHENDSSTKNNEISIEQKNEEKPKQIQNDSINSNTEAVSSPYLARVPMSDSATNSPIMTNNSAPLLINFDDYCSRDELKLIEEAILMLRQDTKVNFVKVRKSLVKHTMRNEEFEKNLKELKKSLDEQRNNSSETASTLEKELNELWQSVDGHLKEFKSDLFAETSRQIEQKSFQHQRENDQKMAQITEELVDIKDQLNSIDLDKIQQIITAELNERILAQENDTKSMALELRNEIDRLIKENELIKEREASSNRNMDLIEELRRDIENLKSNLNNNKLEDEISLLKRDNEELKAHIAKNGNSKDGIDRLRKEIELLKEDNKINENNEIEKLRNEFSSFKQEKQILIEQLKISNNEQLTSEINALKQENQTLIEQIKMSHNEPLASEINALKHDNQNIAVQIEEKLTSEINALKQENQILIEQIKVSHNEPLASEINALKQENKNLAEQVLELKASFPKSEFDALKRENQTLSEQVKASNELTSDINTLKQENRILTEQISELKTLNGNYDQLKNEVSSLKKENDSVKQQVTELNGSLNEYKNTIETLTSTNNGLNTSIESLRSELSATKTRLNEISETTAVIGRQIEEKLTDKNNELESTVKQFADDFKQLKYEENERKNVGGEIQRKMNVLQSAVEEISAKTDRALVLGESSRNQNDYVPIEELRTEISNLTRKQQQLEDTLTSKLGNLAADRSPDREEFSEFKSTLQKQLQSVDYKTVIDALTLRVDTVYDSFVKFQGEFKPRVLALINDHQTVSNLNDTCQKLNSKYESLDDTCQKLSSEYGRFDDTLKRVSNTVSANHVTVDDMNSQIKAIDSSKLSVTQFNEFASDWSSHVKSFSELQALVKSLCESVKSTVAFSADSPHDQTHEIKYEEEFNLTAKKSTTLVQSIRTNNNNIAPSHSHKTRQTDRMSKLFLKILAGTGVGMAAGLIAQLFSVNNKSNINYDAAQMLRKIVQTGLSFGVLIGLSKITSHALHSLHLFSPTEQTPQPNASKPQQAAITRSFLSYNLVGSLFASVCLTGLSGHWHVVTRSTLLGTCSALMLHICLRLRKNRTQSSFT